MAATFLKVEPPMAFRLGPTEELIIIPRAKGDALVVYRTWGEEGQGSITLEPGAYGPYLSFGQGENVEHPFALVDFFHGSPIEQQEAPGSEQYAQLALFDTWDDDQAGTAEWHADRFDIAPDHWLMRYAGRDSYGDQRFTRTKAAADEANAPEA